MQPPLSLTLICLNGNAEVEYVGGEKSEVNDIGGHNDKVDDYNKGKGLLRIVITKAKLATPSHQLPFPIDDCGV